VILAAVVRPRSSFDLVVGEQIPDALDPCVLFEELDQISVEL